MRIANPLYDHAFKFMMSNDRIAKKVLSTILEEEVVELELQQQEILIEDNVRQFTLYRLDFKATIEQADGTRRKVLIELQKSKLPSNVLRFRNYLGATYMEQKQKKDKKTDAKASVAEVLPIVAIYILGYNLTDIPFMAAYVDKKVINASTKEEVQLQSDFLDLLTHKCYVLQVRRLPPERRTRLERFMMLFNQAWISEQNFILDLEEIPEEFGDVAKHLQKPLLDAEMRRKLLAEEEIEDVFALQEARVAQALATAELEREKAEAERKNAEAQRKNAEATMEKMQSMQIKFAKSLLESGVSVADVQRQTGLSEAEILTLQRGEK